MSRFWCNFFRIFVLDSCKTQFGRYVGRISVHWYSRNQLSHPWMNGRQNGRKFLKAPCLWKASVLAQRAPWVWRGPVLSSAHFADITFAPTAVVMKICVVQYVPPKYYKSHSLTASKLWLQWLSFCGRPPPSRANIANSTASHCRPVVCARVVGQCNF